MKRTGSIGSAVPPAVTTTCQPSRSASRRGSGDRRPRARVGLHGPVARRRPTAATMARQLGQPAPPTWPDASGPNSGSTMA